MTTPNELRLLPWSGPGGHPCYLNTDDADGFLSRVADNTEAVQLGMAAELLVHAMTLLGDEEAELNDLRALATDLAGSLRATLRVSVSRGRRLSLPDPLASSPDDEGPRLQAGAFG